VAALSTAQLDNDTITFFTCHDAFLIELNGVAPIYCKLADIVAAKP
jgi:hypothetical protein